MARDEEARRNGVSGADLAAAILASLRISRGAASLSAATLGGDMSFVAERIARLLRPLEAAAPDARRSILRLLALAGCVMSAVVLGTEFGERVVRTLFAVV